MKDAFGKTLALNDSVIYSTKGGGGTEYMIGTIDKLYPTDEGSRKYSPNRVSVHITKYNGDFSFSKSPIIYASNVVLIKGLTVQEEECNPADTDPVGCSDL